MTFDYIDSYDFENNNIKTYDHYYHYDYFIHAHQEIDSFIINE